MSSLLMTGATGLLGRYLLRDGLAAGKQLAVLVRSTPVMSAQQRIEAIVAGFESQLQRTLPRPVVIDGTLLERRLGCSEEQRCWIADNCHAALHSAASLSFEASDENAEPYDTNVNGTRNFVEFCREAGIGQFHYISTAYVSGDVSGSAGEEFVPEDAPFRNDYEKSKAIAEALVKAEFGDRATIYRPSIIVGDSVTGYTSTFRAFYTPLQLTVAAIRYGVLSISSSFVNQFDLDRAARKNLVPVDWVSQATWSIYDNAAAHGRIYHLTNDAPPTVGDIEQAVLGVLQEQYGIAEATLPATSEPLPAEFDATVAVYRTYFGGDPVFDSRNRQAVLPHLPCPAVDAATLRRLIKFAVDAKFSCPNPPPASHARDHFDRLLASAGHRPVESQAAARERLHIELSGPGGGRWCLQFEKGRMCGWETACCHDSSVLVYAPRTTLSAVLSGEIPLQDALDEGRLLIEGSSAEHQGAIELLRSLCRGAPSESLRAA